MAGSTGITTRASKAKVRTGCITCKARRIKCDESKPACLRCISTGRTCDGYTSAPKPAAGLSEPGRLVAREARAQEFFYTKSVPEMSGFFVRPFWDAVLQFGLTEPSIRHAITALATLHEVYSTPLLLATHQSDSVKFAIQSYNRAIATLRKRASDADAMPLVALASIIFTCLECLWGDPEAAATHVTSGISLLRMRRETSGEPTGSWGQNYGNFERAFIEKYLAPVLSTLSLCVPQCGLSNELFLNPVDVNGCPTFMEPFREIPQARVGLIDVVTAAVRLSEEDCSTSQASVKQWCLKTALDTWKMRFDDLVYRQQSSWTEHDRGAADFVRLLWQSTVVGVSVGLISDETAWDMHKPAFEEIIRLVELLLLRQGDFVGSVRFHFEMGIISPLHLVAWKCRWPHLRRKGLALLLSSSRRECLYDAKFYHAVFSRIMALEESHLGIPISEESGQCDLPPEEARIHHFSCEPKSSAADGLYCLKLFSRSSHLESAWDLKMEHLRLDPSDAWLSGSSWSSTLLSTRLPVVNLFRTRPVPSTMSQIPNAQATSS